REAGHADGRRAGITEGREAGIVEGREAGITEGREQGRHEGREQGRHEERVAMLTKLLTLKFGDLFQAHQALIAEASPEQLERYLERVLTTQSIDEVFAAILP